MRLKIVNLNLWEGGRIFKPMVDFLQSEKADLYLFQEVYNGGKDVPEPRYRVFDILNEKLGLPYRNFAAAFIDQINGVDIEQGNAVFSKFPLRDIGAIFYDRPFGIRKPEGQTYYEVPRNLQRVSVRVGKQDLNIFNTQGIWGKDGEDNPRRFEMAEKIIGEIGNLNPLILGGDFNLKDDTKAVSLIEGKLVNVFKNQLKTTFNTKRKDVQKFPGFMSSVVDMVFVTSDIQIIKQTCPEVDVSDHLPLVVEITLA